MHTACPGCGLELPEATGPTHAYIGASPACWQLYGELLAREFSQVVAWDVHGLAVDAYAAQHPGAESRRSTQSVALHLMALELRFGDGVADGDVRERLLRSAAARAPAGLRRLAPPRPLGTLTVRDVVDRDPDEHREAVELWAAGVHEAWAPHRDTVRAWLDEVLSRR